MSMTARESARCSIRSKERWRRSLVTAPTTGRTWAARSPNAIRRQQSSYRRAGPQGLAEGLRLQPSCVGRGRDLSIQAGDRQRAAFAHGPPPGDRGGHRRSCPEPYARARPPGVRPRRMTRTEIGVSASAPPIRAPRSLAVLSPARSTLRASSRKALWPSFSSRTTCRLEIAMPIARSWAARRGTVT
jgi:hypothetical protein